MREQHDKQPAGNKLQADHAQGSQAETPFIFSSFGNSPLRSQNDQIIPAATSNAPLWIGNTFSANRNLADNDATMILSILEKIEGGQPVTIPSPYMGQQGLDEQLAAKKLVKLMPDVEFRRHSHNSQRLETIALKIANEKEIEQSNDGSAALLRERLDNSWRNFFLTVSFQGSQLRDDRRNLSDYEDRATVARTRLQKLEEEQDDLQGGTKDVSSYVRFSTNNHLTLTDTGRELLAKTAERRGTLEGVAFSDLEALLAEAVADQAFTEPATKIRDVSNALQSSPLAQAVKPLELSRRIELFSQTLATLEDQYFDCDPGDHLSQLALAVTLKQRNEHQPVACADEFAACLDNIGCLYREGFNAAAELAFRNGSIESITHEYQKLLISMFAAGHRESVTTAVEATALLDIPGYDIEAKQNLHNRYREALRDEGGWMYGAHATCYIAAKLAVKEGAAAEAIYSAASAHRELELAAIASGRKESVQLGYAALILMDAATEPRQITIRFSEAFQMLTEQGFENKTRLYPTAAFMALRSDDIREQALQIASVRQTLLEEHNITDRFGSISLSLLTGENLVLPVIDKGSPSSSPRSRAGKES